MIQFDLPKEQSSILKVIGIGGGGSNAVNHMYSQHIEGVNFIICNTDAQAIAQSNVPNKVQLGPHLTQGLGAGANPEIGRQATEESLEEIKRMLEVNTKMAFVTAGMGGGTGTGGAPIISKICKDLGILTVGIVTTPFSYEGKKRQLQAEEGIKILKQYVDTLLVISNDKLRHQFGNLKMREAFAKADNVLATAAKCITDVINSTGQINVDFADVCTVMKNGGVAILGNASCEGEDRAQRAIEEALNSPLLNDNEIKGAKWILININSAEGDNEFTMDEVEIIQNYLLSQAGEDTDVILGLGYDNSLGSQIGITLIATGFEHQDPFVKKEKPRAAQPKEDKIVMTLGAEQAKQKAEAKAEDLLTPKLIDEAGINEIPMPGIQDAFADLRFEPEPPQVTPVQPVQKEEPAAPLHMQIKLKGEAPDKDKDQEDFEKKKQKLDNRFEELRQTILGKADTAKKDAGNSGYPSRPSNIYAESKPLQQIQKDEDEEPLNMQLVIKGETGNATPPPVTNEAAPAAGQEGSNSNSYEADEQKRRASERLQKLRNLSFNLNAADPHNEFEHVPAYIRRNMDLQNNSNHVENFYSSYTVKDDGNGGNISTINTFLDGKKPD